MDTFTVLRLNYTRHKSKEIGHGLPPPPIKWADADLLCEKCKYCFPVEVPGPAPLYRGECAGCGAEAIADMRPAYMR